MPTLEDLSRRISVAEDLQSVVRTMKTISAGSIRRCELAEQAMAQYLHTVEMGLQVALRHIPETVAAMREAAHGRTAVVLVGSEIGLCGAFNERLVDFTLERLVAANIPPDQRLILTVGARADAGWRARAEAPAYLQEAPATVEALARTVAAVLTRLDHWRESGRVSQLVLFHQASGSHGGTEPAELPLLPIDPAWFASLRASDWPSRRLPVCVGQPQAVLRNLIRQLLFARVYTAIIQSQTAEHGERLAAMQAADRSIADKIGDLRVDHRQRRQEVITSELLDIIAGYEAAAGDVD